MDDMTYFTQNGEVVVDYTTAWKNYAKNSPRQFQPVSNSVWSPDRGDLRVSTTYQRSVVNRFGEVIEESYNLPVPPQSYKDNAPQLTQQDVDRYVQKTGGSLSGATNQAIFDPTKVPDLSREQPVKHVVAAGVPGYMGHIPHAAAGRKSLEPHDGHFAKSPYKALEESRDKFPKKMPPPGYMGHLHGTVESPDAYGTSRYAPKAAPSRSPRQMSGDFYPPTSGWPVTSGGPLFDPDSKETLAQIRERNDKTIATLGQF